MCVCVKALSWGGHCRGTPIRHDVSPRECRGGSSGGPPGEEAGKVSASEKPLRFGLVGTGYWARITHAPALALGEGIEFAAVWGRDPGAARALAAEHGAAAYADFDELLAVVDGVAFAVPPDVQAAMATRAAVAGKHLLLE